VAGTGFPARGGSKSVERQVMSVAYLTGNPLHGPPIASPSFSLVVVIIGICLDNLTSHLNGEVMGELGGRCASVLSYNLEEQGTYLTPWPSGRQAADVERVKACDVAALQPQPTGQVERAQRWSKQLVMSLPTWQDEILGPEQAIQEMAPRERRDHHARDCHDTHAKGSHVRSISSEHTQKRKGEIEDATWTVVGSTKKEMG
jgi:hypothetical protein